MNGAAVARRSRRNGRDFSIGLRFHQPDVESLALPIPHRLDLDRLARVVIAHDSLESADAIDRLTICRDDHVARLQARLLRRRIVAREVPNENATNVLHTGDCCVLRTNVIDADAESRNAYASVGHELVHHALRQRDRNRETVAGVVARRTGDRAVDTDHLATSVDEWTAGVAR